MKDQVPYGRGSLNIRTLRSFVCMFLIILGMSSGMGAREAGFRRRLVETRDRRSADVPAKPVYKHPFSSRIDAHFSDMRSFYASNKNLEEGPLIACVPFKKASSARVVLAQLYKGVHAVFQDHKLDRVCYMMTHPQVDS